MSRTPFDARQGLAQGRVEGAPGYIAPEGTHVFVLGSDEAKVRAGVVPGDHAEVFQHGSFGNAKAVRLKSRMRGTKSALEGDLVWYAQALIDDVVVLEAAIRPKKTRTLSDLAIPVGDLFGVHKLGFRLVLRGTTAPTSDVELPGFYVDALLLDHSYAPRPQFTNRNPEPDEESVPVDSTIAIDLVDVGPAGIDATRTKVWVDDVLAFDGGAVQSGFNGLRAGSSTLAHTLRIVLDPVGGFDSQSTVIVRVDSAVTGGGVLSETYTFDVEDAAAPRIDSVTATDDRKARVLFNEPMNADTISLASFATTRTTGEISVPVTPIAFELLSDHEVEITFDQEMTPRATYTMTVTGVTDRSDNEIVDPQNVVSFTGWVCPGPTDREWDFFSMLPDLNQEEDEGDLRKFVAILQELGDGILCRVDRFTDIIDPDVAAIQFVEAMLQDLGNPFLYETSLLSEDDRRRLVQFLVPLYALKGVGPGIIAAISFFMGIEVTIGSTSRADLGVGDWELGETWILGTSDEQEILTFRVYAPRLLTAVERTRMAAIIAYMKSEREFFKIIEPDVEAPGDTLDHLELGLSELGVSWYLHYGAKPPRSGAGSAAMNVAAAGIGAEVFSSSGASAFKPFAALGSGVLAFLASGSAAAQSGAASGAGSFYTSPALNTLSGFYRDVPGPSQSWPGTSSAGTSGSRTLNNYSTFSVGTLNGHNYATFNGTNQALKDSNVSYASYVSVSQYTIGLVVRCRNPAAPQASPFNDPGPIGDANAWSGLRWTTSGFGWYHLDSVTSTRKVTPFVAATANAWHKVWVRYDGTTDILEIRVDGGAWAQVTSVGDFPAIPGSVFLSLGRTYGAVGTTWCDCDIAEVITALAPLTDAQINNIDVYFASRFGI